MPRRPFQFFDPTGCVEASRRFDGTMTDIVETSDQWFQLYRAHLFLVSSKDIVPDGPAAYLLSCTVQPFENIQAATTVSAFRHLEDTGIGVCQSRLGNR